MSIMTLEERYEKRWRDLTDGVMQLLEYVRRNTDKNDLIFNAIQKKFSDFEAAILVLLSNSSKKKTGREDSVKFSLMKGIDIELSRKRWRKIWLSVGLGMLWAATHAVQYVLMRAAIH